jgi:hypothetical protein
MRKYQNKAYQFMATPRREDLQKNMEVFGRKRQEMKGTVPVGGMKVTISSFLSKNGEKRRFRVMLAFDSTLISSSTTPAQSALHNSLAKG